MSNSPNGLFGDIDALVPAPLKGAPWRVAFLPVVSFRSTTGYSLAAPPAQPAWEGQMAELQSQAGMPVTHWALETVTRVGN